MQKNSLIAALLALACLNGCAGASLRKGGVKAAASPMQSRFHDLSLSQRQQIFDLQRLTWDGRRVLRAGDSLERKALVLFLEESGAGDLAAVASKTEPAFLQEKKQERAESSDGNKNLWGQNFGSQALNLPADGDTAVAAAAVALAVGAVATTAVSAAIAGKAVVDGVWSDLNPNPTLEDVLEAFNQRLAFALGLDHDKVALYTASPRPSYQPALISRDQRHGRYLVKAGLGFSLAAMGVATAGRFVAANQSQATPEWVGPTFYSAAGALVANLILGWTVVW